MFFDLVDSEKYNFTYSVDWKQEMEGASVPTAEEIAKNYKPYFRSKQIDNIMKDMAKNNDALLNFSKYKDTLISKMNNYGKLEKIIGKVGTLFSIKGVGVGALDLIFLGKDLYKIWNSDKSTSNKIYETGKKISGTVGGIIAGAYLGGKIGIVAGPIGVVVGSVLGSIIGGFIGETEYEYVMTNIKERIKVFAGVFGACRSGGIEFIFPKQIKEFRKNFIFDKCHYIAFEYEDKNFDVNQIINLVNSKFLIGPIKVNNINEIYDTILKEIAFGFLNNKQLPEISLNFNKDSLLYSIMDDYYKNTLTGNILTFLDYYLKSYVNGGFFKEEFIFEWQNNRNVNIDYLQNNITDFKKYLNDLTHNPNKINYLSMYDLGQNSENEHNYVSAFRIIGNMKNILKYYKNILFPRCTYSSQYDFEVLPKWQTKINKNENDKNIYEQLIKAHKIMNLRIAYLMKDIPFLKPYFELLKMITFSIHYLPNIQKSGLFPLFSNSLQNKYMGEKYCKSIPKVFPPLPIRKQNTIKIEFSYKELFDIFKDNNYDELNKFISICFYEAEKGNIDKAIDNQKYLLNKIKNFVIQYVKNKLDAKDKPMVNLFSDKKLRIYEIEKNFKKTLFLFPFIEIRDNYYAIYNMLNEQDNKLYKPKKKAENISEIKSFNDLKKEIEEIMNIFGIYYLDYSENKENYIKLGNKKLYEDNKKIFEKNIERLKASLDKLQNDLIFYKLINDKSIGKLLKFLSKRFSFNLNYTKTSFDKNDENEKYYPIRGGCYPEINNHIILKESEELNEKLYSEFINDIKNKKKKVNKKYYVVKTELRHGFIYGHCLDYFSRTFDINKIIMQIFSASNGGIPNNLKNIKDFSGNSFGFYETIMNIQLGEAPKKENINGVNNFGERPELFAVSQGNISFIKKLISLPNSNFSWRTEGGLTPLGLVLIEGAKDKARILLNSQNIKKNGDLNHCNELGLTYLHLAVESNMDEAVKILLENGSNISLSTRKEENSPIHLMGLLGRNEIIFSIYKNPAFTNNVNNQRPDGKTALHFMSSNSILGTKLLLKAGANSQILDTNEYIPSIYAFFSGRLDCYDLLMYDGNNKISLSLKKKLNSMIIHSSDNENNKNNENKNKINTLLSFNDLIKCYENNDYEGAKYVIMQLKKNNIQLKDDEIYELIELSCKIRNIDFLKLLLDYKSLKDFHIGPYIGKYGLISWLKEITNIGIDIFTYSKTVLDGNNIYDFCILTNDKKLLKNIFKLIDKPSKDFGEIISEIFCKAFILRKNKIIKQLEKELQNSKFKNIKITIKLLSESSDLTLNVLKILLSGFNNIDFKTFNIENVIKYCRPNILEYMLEKTKSNNEYLKKLKNIALENNRLDNLYTLIQKYPSINNNDLNIGLINEKLIEIEELLQPQDNNIIGLGKVMKNHLDKMLNHFNIRFIKLPINNTYLPHLIIKTHNLWAFESLKHIYNDDDIFFLDDESNTCFDYLEPNHNIDSIFFEDLEYTIKYFENKYDKILKVLGIFTKNIKNDIIGFNNKYVEYLLSSLPQEIFTSYDEKYNSIFHIISVFKLDSSLKDIILKKLNELKQKNNKIFITILNLQNINGDTFLFNFLESENYEIAIEILEKFYDEIQINLSNRLGNSILHSLFLNKDFDKISNNFIIYEKIYQLLLKILRKNKNLIIQQNRDYNTPYLLAANSGCNLALTIMFEFYNIKFLESFCESSTALHLACINNNINTVRFLIEYLHYDPNIKLKKNAKKSMHKLPEGSTPLHAAGYASSIEIFEYLLLHGSDPFIENVTKKDAFDVASKYGTYDFLKYIFNLKSSKMKSSNDKYLLSLVQNTQKDSYEIFKEYLKINNFENYNIVDEDMNTLLMLACRVDNPEFISTLIYNGIDPLIKNKYGLNCLHICAYNNSFACAGLVLSKLEAQEEIEKIKEILTSKDKEGNTPMHIAVQYNLENISFLFISYLIRNDIKLKMVKNSAGLTPLQFAIKLQNYKNALIYLKYLNLNILELLNENNLSIEKEFEDFMYCYDSGLLNENIAKIEEKYANINYHINQRNSLPKEYVEKYKEEIKIFKGINYNDYNEGIKLKSFEFLKFNLDKFYKCEILTHELFYEHKNIFGNIYVILTLIRWARKKKQYLIDFYFKFLKQLSGKNINGFLERNNKNNELYNIIEIISIICLPYIDENECDLVFQFLQEFLSIIEKKKTNEIINILKFIKNSIISYFDSQFIKPNIKIFFNQLSDFVKIIFSDEKFTKNFYYTSSSFKVYEFLIKLNKILKLIPNNKIKLCQIQHLNNIPCVLDDEIPNLLKQFHIINNFILFDKSIYDFAKKVLNKKNKNISIINDALFITEKVKDCHELCESYKNLIITYIVVIYEKYIEGKFENEKINEDFSSFLNNFVLLSTQILLNSSEEMYISTMTEIEEQINTFQDLIPYLYIYSSPKEIIFPNLEEKLFDILSKIQLNENDKAILSKIAILIPEYCEKYKYNRELKPLGIKLGKEFKKNPNYDNLSKLIAVISLGVAYTMNMTPYLIQCLSVSSFLLHYIEVKQHKNFNFKGKLAQIKTGEGKSLIIAMLSLANALMGNFVDVITSTHYLAERDQIKFKKLYLYFGVSSSNIIKNNPPKSDYNGIIIYGTNTDFEFSLLREGIYNNKKLFTIPFNSTDNYLIERTYDVAIVDECDNLFLDTARNSARIAHPAKYSFNWIYRLIYKYFSENENRLDIKELRTILNNYENGKYKIELQKINDEKLKELLKSAKIAKEKKLNLDYVIGFDDEGSKKQIQIVSLDTGRIQHGSRWTAGIHEFIEVKEEIEPQTESNVIGSISHPTYFENYNILFGLTGTIGDEIERNEIEEIYKIKCYDIPRNFKEKLINENMEICENKKEKFNKIIEIIKDNKNKKSKALPILVILENIEETIEFGELLTNLKYSFFTLNDVQKENEDYILNNTGYSGSILIATNAAGRGTDIIIDETAKQNGGLYVIIGFFPKNSRIENQAIGRAGRQGNPGKAKIIISKDEEFIYFNFHFIKQMQLIEKDDIKALYLFRKINVNDISKTRIEFCKKERIFFYNLKKYFLLKKFFISLFENNLFKFHYEYISNNIGIDISFEYYKNFNLVNIDNIWSEFYSEFIKERGNKKFVFDDKKDYFIDFLTKFEKEWPECLKELYNDKNKIKADIIAMIIKNLKCVIIKNTEKSFNFNDYRKILSEIELKDLI